jgi:hypothetical protein
MQSEGLLKKDLFNNIFLLSVPFFAFNAMKVGSLKFKKMALLNPPPPIFLYGYEIIWRTHYSTMKLL